MSPDAEVIVVGAGHAGCEAALASARCGISTILVTLNLDTVAMMPCNPSVGGQGKGQLVREIDAMGGQMGIIADETHIQARLLNTRKGLAVQSVRVQSDKYLYGRRMLGVLTSTPNLHLVQGMVTDLIIENRKVQGIRTAAGDVYKAPAVIIAPGTFLRGMIHLGTTRFPAGRAGEPPAEALGDYFQSQGIPMMRFKTGTPPRVETGTIDFSTLEKQEDEPATPPFSLRSDPASRLPRAACHLTHTTPETHAIIREHLHESALVAGRIQGPGPRYCPSIEDKIRKFPQRESHKVFLEPEGVDADEIYLQGLSTSLPQEVQILYVRSLPGLERARMSRPGYAIEYDIIDPTFLFPTLMYKMVQGLFFAGQVNGTSGYEEAAAQGLVAGLNAAALVRGQTRLIMDPDHSFTGLMIEEITSMGLIEPYRIFTSRSQHRLHLRMSNAEARLSRLGHNYGLISHERFQALQERQERIERNIRFLEKQTVTIESLPAHFPQLPPASQKGATNLGQILKRPEIDLKQITNHFPLPEDLDLIAEIEVESRVKYEGYLAQEEKEVRLLKEYQNLIIPDTFAENPPVGLSTESRQRIVAARPRTLGSLARIPGIRATDMILVLTHLRPPKPRQG